MTPETRERLKKLAPWIIGAVVLAAILAMMRGKGGGRGQAGSAPVQDLSMLGGGGGAPVMQQPQVVPAEVADQVAQQFKSSRERFLSMRSFWDEQQGQVSGAPTGAATKAWEQISGGFWRGIKADNRGKIISEQQALALGPQNKGPYAQGGGGFFGSNFFRAILGFGQRAGMVAAQGPLTLGTFAYGGQIPTRGTAPRANGAQAARPPTATRPPYDPSWMSTT